MGEINCSVTVMPVCRGKVGFIRRRKDDTFPELLVAPGGKIKLTDGTMLEGVRYWSVEDAVTRELKK